MSQYSLSQMKIGQIAVIAEVSSVACEMRRRLLDFGLTPGTVIQMERIAPFGDPMQIKIRGCRLALRKREAATIKVK
jgi:ferrous iron transport protein A